MAWTADDLLSFVRRGGGIPAVASTGTTDADILAEADEVMQVRLMPLLISVREEFYVRSTNFQAVVGKDHYRIPGRALGSRVRDVLWLSQGNVTNAPLVSLPRVEPENIWRFASNSQVGEPACFYLENADVVIAPIPPSATGVLRLKWYARPGRLVNATAARQITLVQPGVPDSTHTRLTMAAHTFTTATPVDIIRGSSPFEHRVMDVTPTGQTGTTLDFLTTDLPSFFTDGVGDWVSLADTSPVMQLPVELHPVLDAWVTAAMLASLGFLEEAKAAEDGAKSSQMQALKLLTSRVEGEGRKVVGSMFWRKRWPGRIG